MRYLSLGLTLSMTVACMSGSSGPFELLESDEVSDALSPPESEGAFEEDARASEPRAARKGAAAEAPAAAPAPAPAPADMAPDADQDEPAPPGAPVNEGEREARSWFPESFLWQPLVETDAQGVATVPLRVPDQLTTWRVLALAHSRQGAQAGAVHGFDSRLPVYVDPVVPAWLYVGDRVELPVQAPVAMVAAPKPGWWQSHH